MKAGTFNKPTIDLDDPSSWPDSLSSFLNERFELFLGWEMNTGGASAHEFDCAIAELKRALQPYAIVGWHCSRLTDAEINDILRNGMTLPDGAMLARRVNAVVGAGLLDRCVAQLLKSRNQADEKNRAGMVWFCFFPPRKAGEFSIERFFRHWGGEALHNSHERDPVSSQALARIGTPCLVEAAVPISSLARHAGPECTIIRRFLDDQGKLPVGETRYEGRIVVPLPADCVRRVVRFPGREFLDLTGCLDWDRAIEEVR